MNTIAMHKQPPTTVETVRSDRLTFEMDKPKSHTDRSLRLDQVQIAQDFADRVSKGRLIQIAELMELANTGKLPAVEALYKIQAICNRSE